jgi:hypothetical protein
MKFQLIIIIIIIYPNIIRSQNYHFSIKTGFSHSTQAANISPVAHIRPIEKSIQSVFINVQYTIPIKKNELNVGLQLIEKGYRTEYDINENNLFEHTDYQNSLSYIELPINYLWVIKKINFITGVIFSYMYDCNYRIKQTGINYGNPNIIFATNFSDTYNVKNVRYNDLDFGVNIGFSKVIYENIEIELTAQKHFIRIDKLRQRDLIYNTSLLLGIRYYFL